MGTPLCLHKNTKKNCKLVIFGPHLLLNLILGDFLPVSIVLTDLSIQTKLQSVTKAHLFNEKTFIPKEWIVRHYCHCGAEVSFRGNFYVNEYKS